MVPDMTAASQEVEKTFHADMPTCVKDILHDFKDVFPTDLPPSLRLLRKGHEFCIDLEDVATPVHKPIYKLSSLKLEEARKHIDYMLEHGYIRPSDSPYGSLVPVVPKKHGGLRFCIDY